MEKLSKYDFVYECLGGECNVEELYRLYVNGDIDIDAIKETSENSLLKYSNIFINSTKFLRWSNSIIIHEENDYIADKLKEVQRVILTNNITHNKSDLAYAKTRFIDYYKSLLNE